MKPIHLRLAVLMLIIALGTPAIFAAALPPITSVSTDATGRLIVNGKPFFPILIYDAPTDDATLAQLSDFGFNTLAVVDAKAAATLPARGFYALSAAPKKIDDESSVLLINGIDSPMLELKGDVVGQTVALNKKASDNCPGRPVSNAIGFWLNEPVGVAAGSIMGKDQYEDLVAAIDMACPYLYPIPYQPVSTVGDAVERAHAATDGKKMVLPILQLFTWDPKDRYPTPDELRCMVYLSLVEGANGIGYYTYGSVKAAKHPVPAELWASVKPLNAEVAKIGRRFIEGEPFDGVKEVGGSPESVKWRAVKGMLVAVNSGAKAQAVKFRFDNPPVDIRPVGAPMTNVSSDGGFEYTLNPLGVMVIEF